MYYADLHLHTHFSDGTFSPEELVARAARKKFKAIALTDHDTLEGCPRTAAACREAGIEFIAASELTAEIQGREIHILGYFLDPENRQLQAELARFQEVRQTRIHEMVRKLNELGIPLQVEKVLALASCKSPGRPHVARALVEAGFCQTVDEAFATYLKIDKPAWVPKAKMSAAAAIDLIHQAGGLAVLAHPGIYRADSIIPDVIAAGLDGIECFHSKHNNTATRRYLDLAKEQGLLVTGGSDCHGMTKGKPLIGTVKVPYEYVEQMRNVVLQRAVERGILFARLP